VRATEPYTHGHHASVVGQHARRTARRDAAYLVPHLRAGQRVLDVGCGPGTITCELATLVAPGETHGIDASAAVLQTAREHAAAQPHRPHFQRGSVYALAYPERHFDVVHAHQVLQHLAHPVEALTEMRRVLRPNGVLAVRDADYATMCAWPERPEIDRWLALYHAVAERNGAEPDAGRRLPSWIRAAGFDAVETTADVVWISEPAETRNWGRSWADRVQHSNLGKHALDYALATPEELDWIAAGFRSWCEAPDAVFFYVNVACLSRAPDDPAD